MEKIIKAKTFFRDFLIMETKRPAKEAKVSFKTYDAPAWTAND